MIQLARFLTSREAGDPTGPERLYRFVLYLMYICGYRGRILVNIADL